MSKNNNEPYIGTTDVFGTDISKKKLLMDYIAQDIVKYLMNDCNLDYEASKAMFAKTTVFEKLYNTESGLYLEGSLYIYDLLQNELRNGRLVREEY